MLFKEDMKLSGSDVIKNVSISKEKTLGLVNLALARGPFGFCHAQGKNINQNYVICRCCTGLSKLKSAHINN
jgi:hypothetical protein